MTIKVRFFEKRTNGLGSRELLPPPPESVFELELQTLPKVGDILHIHTDLLPPYYTKGGVEPHDIKVNRDESAGEYRDTVMITVAGRTTEPQDSVVHIINPGIQLATLLFYIDRYPQHSYRNMKR